MGLANGAFMVVIAGYCFTLIQYPLKEEKDFAWTALFLSMLFEFGLFAVFYYNELKFLQHATLAISAIGVVGLYQSRVMLLQKTI